MSLPNKKIRMYAHLGLRCVRPRDWVVDNVDFVDAHPLWYLEADGLLKLDDIVAADVSGRTLDRAGFVGQRAKGALQRLLLDPLRQPAIMQLSASTGNACDEDLSRT